MMILPAVRLLLALVNVIHGEDIFAQLQDRHGMHAKYMDQICQLNAGLELWSAINQLLNVK